MLPAHQKNPKRESARKQHTDRRVERDAPAPVHETNTESGDHRNDSCADVVIKPAQIRDHDSGERRVSDTVADKRKSPQYDVRAHSRA